MTQAHEPWLISVIKAGIIINVVMVLFAYMTWLERKTMGRMQRRYGPNRAGPFGLLQPIFGFGITPAIIGLTLYGIYPVLRNTVAGLASVDPPVLEAARGVGIGPIRRTTRLHLPLAWPVRPPGTRPALRVLLPHSPRGAAPRARRAPISPSAPR